MSVKHHVVTLSALFKNTIVNKFILSLSFAPQQFPDQIVGFVPRKHVSTPGGVYSYGSFELQDPETAGGDR